MPKTIRDRLKGSIATSYLDIERALAQIHEVYEVFKLQHEELANALEIAATMLIHAQDILEKFYERSWGYLPDDWYKTRNRK